MNVSQVVDLGRYDELVTGTGDGMWIVLQCVCVADSSFPALFMAHLRLERSELAELLRSSVDVGIFPNRAEGGTNMVAMEGSASGVPLILSRATGQGDLVRLLGGEHNAYFLTPYRAPRDTEGEEGWAESSVQEVSF